MKQTPWLGATLYAYSRVWEGPRAAVVTAVHENGTVDVEVAPRRGDIPVKWTATNQDQHEAKVFGPCDVIPEFQGKLGSDVICAWPCEVVSEVSEVSEDGDEVVFEDDDDDLPGASTDHDHGEPIPGIE